MTLERPKVEGVSVATVVLEITRKIKELEAQGDHKSDVDEIMFEIQDELKNPLWQIGVTRDLSRKPEVRYKAFVSNPNEPFCRIILNPESFPQFIEGIQRKTPSIQISEQTNPPKFVS